MTSTEHCDLTPDAINGLVGRAMLSRLSLSSFCEDALPRAVAHGGESQQVVILPMGGPDNPMFTLMRGSMLVATVTKEQSQYVVSVMNSALYDCFQRAFLKKLVDIPNDKPKGRAIAEVDRPKLPFGFYRMEVDRLGLLKTQHVGKVIAAVNGKVRTVFKIHEQLADGGIIVELHTGERATVHRNAIAQSPRINHQVPEQEIRSLVRTLTSMPEWGPVCVHEGAHACAIVIRQYEKDWMFGQDYYLMFDNLEQAQGVADRLAGWSHVGRIDEQWTTYQRDGAKGLASAQPYTPVETDWD